MAHGIDGSKGDGSGILQDGIGADPVRATLELAAVLGAPPGALDERPAVDAFEPAFRASPVALVISRDAHCRVVLRNAAMNRLLPASLEWQAWRLPDGTAPALYEHGEPLPLDRQPLRRAAFAGERSIEREMEMRWPGRAPVWLRIAAEPLFDAAGTPCGAVGSAVDITIARAAEHAAAQRYLVSQRDALSASRAKDELIALLGHELRNPLNAIATAVEVLNRANPVAPEAQSARGIIGRQTRRLAQLLGDVSEIGQAIGEGTALARVPVALGALLARCAERATPAASAKGQRIVLEQIDFRVDADAPRLAQAIDRLLDDAVQSTPDGGLIGVRSRRGTAEYGAVDAVIEIRGVTDAGRLPPAALDEDAGPHRPPLTSDRHAGGFGFWLTLVKRIAEQHGGCVDARRHDPATGGFLATMRLPTGATTR